MDRFLKSLLLLTLSCNTASLECLPRFRPGLIKLQDVWYGKLGHKSRCTTFYSGTKNYTILWPQGTRIIDNKLGSKFSIPSGKSVTENTFVLLQGGELPITDINMTNDPAIDTENCKGPFFLLYDIGESHDF
jgi:hypothetical protein